MVNFSDRRGLVSIVGIGVVGVLMLSWMYRSAFANREASASAQYVAGATNVCVALGADFQLPAAITRFKVLENANTTVSSDSVGWQAKKWQQEGIAVDAAALADALGAGTLVELPDGSMGDSGLGVLVTASGVAHVVTYPDAVVGVASWRTNREPTGTRNYLIQSGAGGVEPGPGQMTVVMPESNDGLALSVVPGTSAQIHAYVDLAGDVHFFAK